MIKIKKRYIILTPFLLLIGAYTIHEIFRMEIDYWDYMGDAKKIDAKSTYAFKAKHKFVELPDRSLNDSTLRGIDSDKNGVRDDIDYYIYKMARDEVERKVFYQIARTREMMFEYKEHMYDKDGKFVSSSSYGIGDAMARSDECFYYLKYKKKYLDIQNHFSKLYYNTKERDEYVEEYIYTAGFTYGLFPSSEEKKDMEFCE